MKQMIDFGGLSTTCTSRPMLQMKILLYHSMKRPVSRFKTEYTQDNDMLFAILLFDFYLQAPNALTATV